MPMMDHKHLLTKDFNLLEVAKDGFHFGVSSFRKSLKIFTQDSEL